MRRRLASLALAAASLAGLAACGGGSAASPTTSGAAAPAGSVAPSTAGEAPLTAPAAGTLPQPVGPGTPTVGASGPTAGPGSTIVTLTGGDPAVFCPNLELSFPGSFVISLGGSNDPSGAAVAEVAMAPVLAPALDAIARSAPRELAAPFVLWDDRNRQALAAFQAVGAPADKVAAYVKDLTAELRKMQDGSSTGAVFDDLPATAARYGIDQAGLVAQGTRFGNAFGYFDDFFDQLSLDITLSPDVQAQLEKRFPCAADLANPVG